MTEPGQALDRYRAVGLRNNPFAADSPNDDGPNDDGPNDDGPNDDSPNDTANQRFVSRGLPSPPPPGSRTLVQVIGDQGAGKTTHVRRWQSITPGPYHYVPRSPYHLRWRRPPVGPIVYADEIDRMPRPIRWAWFRALARAGSTAVTGTHLDLTGRAKRAGLTVITHRLGAIDRSTLDAIIAARLRSAATGDEAIAVVFDEDDLAHIHHKSGGSVREAEILCHELLAERVL